MPERGSLNDDVSGLNYAKSLRETLLKDSAFYYRARVICTPSGEPAWAITLTEEGEDDHRSYFIEYAVFEGGRAVRIEDAPVRRVKAPITLDAAEAVQRVWMRMLREVRYPEKAVGGQADGATYHFSRFVPLTSSDPGAPSGWEAGTIWSPRPTSFPGRLVSLGEAMRGYALARAEERGASQDRIFKQAVGLEAELVKHHKSTFLRRPGRDPAYSTGRVAGVSLRDRAGPALDPPRSDVPNGGDGSPASRLPRRLFADLDRRALGLNR